MTEQSAPFPPVLNPLLQPYVDFWSSCVEQATDTTRRMMDNVNGTSDPRAIQRRWLEAVSRSSDAYLRSPQFLKAMKQSLDAATQAKMQIDDLQKEVARNANIPMASDISGLFERLRGIEELILSRLGDIEERLEVIESGLQEESSSDGNDDAHQEDQRSRPSRKKKASSKFKKKRE